jgi:hypothetical protein
MTEKDLVETNFDLEQSMLNCWSITTDIKELVADFEQDLLTTDEVMDILKSYAVVYENRFNRTWRYFEQVTSGIHLSRKGLLERELTLDPLLDGVALKTTLSKTGKKGSKNG